MLTAAEQAADAQEAQRSQQQDQESPDGDPESPQPPPPAIDPGYVRKLQAELRDARREAATHRTKLKTLEDGQISEADKLRRDLTEAQTQAATLAAENRRLALAGVLRDAGARYPDLLVAHVPADADPAAPARWLKDVRAAYPDLFGGGDKPRGNGADGAAGGSSQPVQNMNTLLRQSLQARRRGG